MKVKLQNIGVIRYAEFDLGALTLIFGENNTGKTYATYSLYGFLDYWRHGAACAVADTDIESLRSNGSVCIPLASFRDNAEKLLATNGKQYSKLLSFVFATKDERFKQSQFSLQLRESKLRTLARYTKTISSQKKDIFAISMAENQDALVVTLLGDRKKMQIPLRFIQETIGEAIKEVIFGGVIPKPFIVSTERTGAAIFRGELNFARNRLVEELGSKDKDFDPFQLIEKFNADYALPVRRNVEFIRHLETISKSDSFLVKEHPDILADFASILGGDYEVSRNDELRYIPKGKRVKLTMDESSSSVRSLLDLGFYLRHVAQRGDMLMIDEPELNLHPKNQRKVARLLARLVNVGIKVFVTTHSDYLVKELNTLIMLKQAGDRFRQLAKREGYQPDELLEASLVKAYMARQDLVKCPGAQKRSTCQTLVPVLIDESGMQVESFDGEIEDIARIHDEIIWGDK